MEALEIILISLGIAIVVTTLIMALKILEPTVFRLLVFRVIMALGAACLGAIIPGFINLVGELGEITIRAGGAIALFLVVYLINPPSNVRDFAKLKK